MIKKIIFSACLLPFFACASERPFEFASDQGLDVMIECYEHDAFLLPLLDAQLSDQERDYMWREMHFCKKKVHINLEKAYRVAGQITDIDTELAVKAAMSGAIGGISTGTPCGVVIGALLSTLGHIAAESYSSIKLALVYCEEVKFFARRADYLQEKLWLDENP